MRIAQVSDWFHPRVGGIERHVKGLAPRLRARGVDTVVVTPWDGPDEVDGTPVRRLELVPMPGLRVSLSPRLFPAVEEAIGSGGYDLVHSHMSLGSSVAIAALRAAARLGIPALATFHSVFGSWRRVHVAAEPLFGWRRWNFRVSAVSDAVAGDLAWMMPERPVTLLPCAIEESLWRGLAPDPVPERLRLVATSRLHRRKRVEALVRVVHEVRRRVGPRVDVTLEVVGDGPRRRALETLVGTLGLERSVRLPGQGDEEAVQALLARGDVFVNACPLESFGIAALEALSAGLPVVARAQGGIGTFVENGVNGVLVESDEAMADALVHLARNRERLQRLRKGADGGIPGEFTWSGLVERHLDLYAEMLDVEVSAVRPDG